MLELLVKDVLPNVKKVTLIVEGDSEQCTVAIIADPKKDGLKVKPMTVSGTVTEVAAGLQAALKAVFVDNKQYFDNSAEVIADLKEQSDKPPAAKKTTGKAKAEKTADDTTEEDDITKDAPVVEKAPKLDAKQKAAEKKAADAIGKAKGAVDPDMVAFLRKQVEASYTEVAMPAYYVDRMIAAFNAIVVGEKKDDTATVDTGMFAGTQETVKEEPKVVAEAPVAEAKKVEEVQPAVVIPAKNKEEDEIIF